MDPAPDFGEFCESLNAHGVEFVIVGAHALAFHGAPRYTGDLDIYHEVHEAAAPGRLGAQSVLFIGRAQFIKNRRAAARAKDLADVAALEGDEPA